MVRNRATAAESVRDWRGAERFDPVVAGTLAFGILTAALLAVGF